MRSSPRTSGGAPAGGDAAVDERRAGSGPADREAIGDVEVAGRDVVLVQGRNRERVRAGRDHDHVGPGNRVRLLDRGPQRAHPGGRPAQPVADAGVERVGRAVYLEVEAGGACHPRRLEAEEGGEGEDAGDRHEPGTT